MPPKPKMSTTYAASLALYNEGQARDAALRKAQLAAGLITPSQPTKGACGAAKPTKGGTP